MSCSYYLRDKRITEEKIRELKELEDRTNEKIRKIYEEINNEISSILPIEDQNIIPECRQYEKDYEPQRFYIQDVRDLEFGVVIGNKFRFNEFSLETYNQGFRSIEHFDFNKFIEFYKSNKDKYIIIDEYEQQYTLKEFLKKIDFQK